MFYPLSIMIRLWVNCAFSHSQPSKEDDISDQLFSPSMLYYNPHKYSWNHRSNPLCRLVPKQETSIPMPINFIPPYQIRMIPLTSSFPTKTIIHPNSSPNTPNNSSHTKPSLAPPSESNCTNRDHSHQGIY